MLTLRLLGGTDVLVDGDAVQTPILRQPKRLALLAYLACRRDFVRRDTLAALFWPEHGQERARSALRKALHDVRHALGDVIAVRGREEVGVDASLLTADVARFRDALAARDYARAVELYRGPLLDGFYLSGCPDFERWLDEERSQCRRLLLEAAVRLVDDTTDPVAALAWARRAAVVAPEDEAVAYRMIALLHRLGDRAGAIRVYDRLASHLRQEYDVEPAPETQALLRSVRERANTGMTTATGGAAPHGHGPPQDADAGDASAFAARAQQNFFQLSESGFTAAEADARRALALQPDLAQAWSTLAGVTAYRFELDRDPQHLVRALEFGSRALQLEPELPDVHLWLGYACERQHRHEKAVLHCHEAARRMPGMYLPDLFLGTVLLCWGLHRHEWERLVEAAGPLARAAQIDPTDVSSHLQLTWLYLLAGDYAFARPLLDAGAALERQGRCRVRVVGALPVRGILHLREQQWNAAAERFDAALQLYEGSDNIHAPLFRAVACCGHGELAVELGRHDDAITWYRAAHDVAAAHPRRAGMGYAALRACTGLAVAFHRLMLFRDAAQQFGHALDLLADPASVDGHWAFEACDALARLDVARYHAAAGHRDEMLRRLHEAVDAGWGDLPRLDTDLCFAGFRRDPALDAVRRRVRERPPLPTLDFSGDLPA